MFQNYLEMFEKSHSRSQLKKYYEKKSMLDIAGYSRKEQYHSNFIYWLLNPHESHALGKISLIQLLKLLFKRLEESKEMRALRDEESLFLSLFNNSTVEEIEVVKEIVGEQGRLDLLVKCKLVDISNQKNVPLMLVLENKVLSSESNEQTERYWQEYGKNDKSGNIVLFVYLTPAKPSEVNESLCSNDNFININYQQMYDWVFANAINHIDATIDDKFILNDYILSLSYIPSKVHESNSKGLIMAITDEEKVLVNQFLEENKEFLIRLCETIDYDSEQEQQNKEIAEKLHPLNKKTRRNVSSFLWEIYESMEPGEEVEWKDIKNKVHNAYQDLTGNSMPDASVNTPLYRHTVNHPSRGKGGAVNAPFPDRASLFYISREDGRKKFLRKFIPNNNVDNVDICWKDKETGRDISLPFHEIKEQFDSNNYEEWSSET